MELSLALIGLLGGLITGISPCILPVLPVIFLLGRRARAPACRWGRGVSTVSRWRPFLVILGLVTSFSVFTLLGSFRWRCSGCPRMCCAGPASWCWCSSGWGSSCPRSSTSSRKPFSWIPQKAVGTERGGFTLGIALGAVYVPCAGPVLAAITVAGSTGRIGVGTIVPTVSFAIGAALPLLVFALAGRRVAERVKAFRARQKLIRTVGGVVMIALAVGIAFNAPQAIQRLLPDYTSALQGGSRHRRGG